MYPVAIEKNRIVIPDEVDFQRLMEYVMMTRNHLTNITMSHDCLVDYARFYLQILKDCLSPTRVSIQVGYEHRLALIGDRKLLTDWMSPHYSNHDELQKKLKRRIAGFRYW